MPTTSLPMPVTPHRQHRGRRRHRAGADRGRGHARSGGWHRVSTMDRAPVRSFQGMACVSSTDAEAPKIWGNMYNGSANAAIADMFGYIKMTASCGLAADR
ncbi:hypothetical protein [Streptosporangium sp. 'caverna']|uniref:hypothetical protein n=1 Tax=Streptosporangium sp. 'caverna' TaxID=2202249 RepID=UPI0013A70CE8|nr:hypothetical protein [Streptosporangium sp. 'caverna']